MDLNINLEDIDNIEFVNAPSNSLLCPVCRDICNEPLITHRCHHSYCAKCIYQSIQMEPFCPLCRCRLKNEDLHPNLALASLINELQVKCKNKVHGCIQTIRLDAYESHLKTCNFNPAKCTMKPFGCDFFGTKIQVEQHLEECIYYKIFPFINKSQSKLVELENKYMEQKKEIEMLKQQLNSKQIDNTILNKSISQPSISKTIQIEDRIEDRIETFPNGDITLSENILGHTSGVTSLAYSNGLLFSGAHDGSTKVYDTNNNQIIWSNQAHSTSVWGLTVFTDEKKFFTASSDKLIKVWDCSQNEQQNHQPLKVLDQHKGKIYSLLCRFGKLFSGSSDTTINIWDPRSYNLNATLLGHKDNINSIVALRNNKLATGSSDKTIKIWDINTTQCINTINTNNSEILDVVISDDQELLFGSTYDASILVYNLNNNELITTLYGHDWEVWQLAFNQNRLFSASFDHKIKRWDIRMNKSDLTLLGHKGFVHALAIADDKLFSGCADRTIKVWK